MHDHFGILREIKIFKIILLIYKVSLIAAWRYTKKLLFLKKINKLKFLFK